MAPKRRVPKKSSRARKSDLSVSTDESREYYKNRREKLTGFIADFDLAVEEHLAMMDNTLISYLTNMERFSVQLIMQAPLFLWKANYIALKESKRGDAAAGAEGMEPKQENMPSDDGIVKTVPPKSLVTKDSSLKTAVKSKYVKKAFQPRAKGIRTLSQSVKQTRTSERLMKTCVTPVVNRWKQQIPSSACFGTSKASQFTPRVTRTPCIKMGGNGDNFLLMSEHPCINLPLTDGQVLTCHLGTPLEELMKELDSQALETMTQMRDYLNHVCNEAKAMNIAL